jgi:uncharacterized membrane protein YhaH (DUF805 family)
MFAGTISRGDYTRAAAMRLGLFSSGVLAVPAALYALDRTQYCPPHLCGPMSATMITFYVMPVLYFGLLWSLIGISVRRLRDIGLPVALAAVLPMLMLGDLLAALTLDGFAFDSYTRAVHPIPGNIVMALACVSFLCVARSENGDGAARRWGRIGAVTLGIVTLASILALFKFISEAVMAFSGATPDRALVYAILYAGALIAPILLIASFALLGLRHWQPRAA